MDTTTVAIIILMAIGTYLTRIIGFLVFRNRVMSVQVQQVMQAAPGCVLIAVLAPKFVTSNPIDLLAIVITLFVASRVSILPAVVISVAATGLLRAVTLN